MATANKTTNTRKNALLPEDAVEAPVTPSKPTLDLNLSDLKIIVDAMLGLRNTPENVDVYYKIETYRQALKDYLNNEK